MRKGCDVQPFFVPVARLQREKEICRARITRAQSSGELKSPAPVKRQMFPRSRNSCVLKGMEKRHSGHTATRCGKRSTRFAPAQRKTVDEGSIEPPTTAGYGFNKSMLRPTARRSQYGGAA